MDVFFAYETVFIRFAKQIIVNINIKVMSFYIFMYYYSQWNYKNKSFACQVILIYRNKNSQKISSQKSYKNPYVMSVVRAI